MYDYFNNVDASGRLESIWGTVYTDGADGISIFSRADFVKKDPETGMPVTLKEGDYFRVTTSKDLVRVSYMRKRWWWLDKEMDQRHSRTFDREISNTDILYLALFSLYKAEEEVKRVERIAATKKLEKKQAKDNRALRKTNSRFNGNYPPKVLK